MKIKKSEGNITYEVESAFEVINEPMPASTMPEWNMKMGQRRERGWFNGDTAFAGEVLKQFEVLHPFLWEDALQKVSELSAPMNKKALKREVKRKRKRCKGDFGNEVDIHAVRQGHMDRAWSRTKFVERDIHGSKHVTLLVNCGMHSGITAEQAEWRTAAVIETHDALVKMGKSVEIVLIWALSRPYRTYLPSATHFFYAPLKNAGTHMSPKHLAMYTSASFIRLLMLNRFVNLPGHQVNYGYGHALNSYTSLPWRAQQMKNAGHHVVTIGQCFHKTTAEQVIEAVVKQVKDADASPRDRDVEKHKWVTTT